jgi:hypothetical protein
MDNDEEEEEEDEGTALATAGVFDVAAGVATLVVLTSLAATVAVDVAEAGGGTAAAEAAATGLFDGGGVFKTERVAESGGGCNPKPGFTRASGNGGSEQIGGRIGWKLSGGKRANNFCSLSLS